MKGMIMPQFTTTYETYQETLRDLQGRIDENKILKAENTRLRAALEAAPDPRERGLTSQSASNNHFDRHDGPRAEALKGESQ